MHAGDERRPCMLANFTKRTLGLRPASDDRGQRSRSTPGELELAGRHKTLLCSCTSSRNQVVTQRHQTCPEVLKERLNVDFPEFESCPCWGANLNTTSPRRVQQLFKLPASTATAAQASTATVSEASTATASHLRKPKLSRRCRECVHEVDSVSEDNSSVT